MPIKSHKISMDTMFGYFKDSLKKIYNQFTSKAKALFSSPKIDQETLSELEKILITADASVSVTRKIIANLQSQVAEGKIKQGSDLHDALAQELLALLASKKYNFGSDIYLLVGINGSGKTTLAGKLAALFKSQNKRVLLVAADTFRAAATEQLVTWANKLGVDVVTGKQDQDPASVVFTGCQKYLNEQYDILIIDTAGRLQTKINLMKELEKIKKIINAKLISKHISTLLIIDSMLGQNSFEQARIFNESTQVDGIVLTKMDGTGKGGIVFAIVDQLHIPIAFISFGEQADQIARFDAKDYVEQLLSK